MRILLLLLCLFSFWTHNQAVALATTESAARKQRNYPGGRDEDDLKVRSELPQPNLTVNRRQIEEQVLKKWFQQAEKGDKKTADKQSEKNTQQ